MQPRAAAPWWHLSGAVRRALAWCAVALLALAAPSALAQVSVSVSDASVVEGNSGTRSMVFTVTRSGDTTAARVRYATVAGGSATAATDYTSASGTLSLAAGQATATFSVPVRGDTLVEPQETVLVALSDDPLNAQPLVFLDDSGTGTIIDDDTAPTVSLSLSPSSVTENGSPNLVYRVELSQPYGVALAVNFGTGGTATPGTDYGALPAAIAVAAGATSGTLTVNPTGDTTLEPHETVVVTLLPGSNYTVGAPATATGTILNDDNPLVNVSVSPASVGEDAGTDLVYTFTLSQPRATDVSLVYTRTGTATAGTDYTTAAASPLVIPAGSTSGTVVVSPVADTAIEANETVILTLQTGSGYTRGTTPAATGTLVNDDTATATIAVAPASVTENGTPNLVYTVTLSQVSTVATSVNFTLAGTATSGTDYAAVASPLVIAAGATSRTLTINPTADTTIEPDETVIVALAPGSGYVVGSPDSATGTIGNDDLPGISIDDITLLEGDSGISLAVFNIKLAGTPLQPLSFNYATANGTASSSSDYVATSGTMSLPAGTTAASFTVPVRGDTTAEANEYFVVNLSGAVNARITDSQVRATITDDDTRVATVALAPAAVTEDGMAGLAYAVTLSRPALSATTIRFTTTGTATAGSDYAAVGTTLVIPAGGTGGVVTVVPTADTMVEADETVVFTLVAGTGYVVGAPASATGTIGNDDLPEASVSVAPARVDEDGGAALVFTVALSQPAVAATSVDFSLGGSATAGGDYAGVAGTVAFAPGQSTATVPVTPSADATPEPDEDVVLTLLPGSGYGVGAPASASGTIGNDDLPAASVTVSTPGTAEDDGTAVVFTVALSQAAATDTFVEFALGGTASDGSDYTATAGPLRIPAGDTQASVAVTAVADGTVEADETVVLGLLPGAGYTVGAPDSATTSITNDDRPTVTVLAPAGVAEDSGTALAFTLVLSQPALAATTIDFSFGGTATAGTDYVAPATSVLVPAGETTATVSVTPLADALVEADESVVLALAAGSGYDIGSPDSAATTLANDDLPLASVAVATASATEDSGTPLRFVVTLSQPSPTTTTVGFSLGGTATAGSDYPAIAGSVSLPAGDTTAIVAITPLDDALVEADETIELSLQPGPGYLPGAPASATATIGNDDRPLATVTVAPASVGEDAGTPLVYRVMLSQPAAVTTTVDFSLGGSALAGSDYTAPAPALVIAAGDSTGTVAVNPIADATSEADETVVLTLVAGSDYLVGAPSGATGTIADDDVPVATLAVAPAVVAEDAGAPLVFTVTLSQPARVATAVRLAASGSATAGSDYPTIAATLVIAAGSDTGRISVLPLADSAAEADESLSLSLVAGTGYTLGAAASATAILGNDDSITVDAMLPPATVGGAYVQRVRASGGSAPYRYALTGGVLPAGLRLSDDGTVQGTPTAGGTFALTITATDSRGFNGSASPTLRVEAPPLALVPGGVPPATAGVAYRHLLVASGGTAPYRFALSGGALPAGMVLAADGTLSGTPRDAGSFEAAVTITDSSAGAGPYSGTLALVLQVATAAIVATDDSGRLDNGARGGVAVADVLANDRLDGEPARPGAVTLLALPTTQAQVSLDAGTGAVHVAPGTAAGTYTLGYRLCDARQAANCRDATVTVHVGAAAIDAVDDAGAAMAGADTPTMFDVLANDTLDAGPASSSSVRVARVSSSDPALVLDADGTLQVGAAVAAGTQQLVYRLCETLNPDNCDEATVTLALTAVPVAPSASVEVTADAPARVDLGEGARGGPFTAATLLSLSPQQAGRASIRVIGSGADARYLLEFTPAPGFNGQATVRYTLANAFAVSAAATVAFQVQPRPDPSQDADVRGLVDAQVQSARRFAEVQGDNVRGRLEGLHGQRSAGSLVDNRVGFPLSRDCVREVRPGERGGQPPCAPEQDGLEPAPAATPDPDAAQTPARAYGAWIAGQVRSGNFDGAGSGVGFETDGLSLGMDIDLAADFTLGAALGYGRDDSRIGERGSQVQGRATSYMGYASYHPGRFFLDGLAGYQQLAFDLRRVLPGGSAGGTRDGGQWFASLVLGADLPAGDGQLTPYARMDLANARLDAYAEAGHPTRALRFEAMDLDTRTGNLGARYDFRVAMAWGTLTPQLRAEYQYDFADPQAAVLRYADVLDGAAYRMDGTRVDRSRLVFGAGVTLDWTGGLGVRVEYRTESGSDSQRDHNVSVNVQKQF